MDRRTHPRVSCLLKAMVRAGMHTFQATLTSLSEGGAFIASREHVQLGDRVQLRFRRPDDAAIVEIGGAVRRLVPQPLGAEFEPGFAVEFGELLADAEPEMGGSDVYPVPPIEPAASISTADPTAREPPDAGDAPAPIRVTVSGEYHRPEAPTDPAPERRARDSRYVTTIRATLIPLTGQSEPLDGELTDVSLRGLAVDVTPQPPVDEVLTVRIAGWDVDGKSAPLDIVAQVQRRWESVPATGEHAGVGCRIVAFGDERARRRYEALLKALLVVGNPIVGR